MEKNEIKETKRNVSLDLLRIVSMFMVLLLHYLAKGQLLNIENVSKISYSFFYFIESLSIVAVNCYILISGYFLIKSQFKLKKLLKIWGEVVFYSISIYILVVVLKIEKFNFINAIKAFFPVITNQYWFVTSYIALYILSPFINKLIYSLTKEEYKKMLIILLIMFSFVSFLPSDMLLDKTGGYGIIWFICLYLIAAYIRLYMDKEKIKKCKKIYLLIYIIFAILTTIGIFILQYVFKVLDIRDLSGKLLNYNMPLVLVESLCLFLLFNSIEIKNKVMKKIVLFIAPLTFAVYVIHETPALSKILYKEILHTEICFHNSYAIFIIVGSIIAIFSVCILIEYLRRKILNYINN